jgi:small subunit ribosomal protein S8
LTDPVADFLTRIRNAISADREHAIVPASRMNRELARVLRDEGYIDSFAVEKTDKPPGASSNSKTTAEFEALRITLRYTEDREPVISGLQRISKPGRRQYANADELPRVLGGMGTAILTTSKGVMTAYQARSERVGGEVLAHVW